VQPAVAYLRVSTGRQGRSGPGLDAQRERCAAFAAQQGLEIVEAFTEVETGKGSDALDRRPRLAAALAAARRLRGPVGVRHGSMRQPAAVDATATGDRDDGSETQRRARGGAGMRPER
jgi:resolvase-like protein